MPRTKKLTIKQTKDMYWEDAKACLIQFHGMSEKDAQAKVDEFIAKYYKSMIYHDEAFDTANWISGKELCYTCYKDDYNKILDKSYIKYMLKINPHLKEEDI